MECALCRSGTRVDTSVKLSPQARIIVTGGSGFLGSELIPVLRDQGHDVHMVGRSARHLPGVTFHACDLLDSAAVRNVVPAIGATHLAHLAWYAEPGLFWSAPENLDWVAASLHLIRAFAQAGGKRAVVAGSCAEYDWSAGVCAESTPLIPASFYGQCKAALFNLLETGAPRLGISLAWGRIFFPYGPFDREERLLGSLLASIRNNRSASLSSGTQQRDFMHAEDVAAAIAAVLFSDTTGAINIGTGQAVSVRRFVEIAAAAGGAGPDRLRFGDRPVSKGEPPVLVADITRFARDTGFVPKFSLEDGIADSVLRNIAHWQSNGKSK